MNRFGVILAAVAWRFGTSGVVIVLAGCVALFFVCVEAFDVGRGVGQIFESVFALIGWMIGPDEKRRTTEFPKSHEYSQPDHETRSRT